MTKKIFIIILPILLLTGCYDYKELKDIAIVGAIEINKVDNTYIVKAQAINPQDRNEASTTQAPFFIYTGKGNTLQEAFRNITLESSKFLYANHLQLLIINEQFAKQDMSEMVDFIARNPGIRSQFYVLVGQNENILDAITPIDDISSSSIKQTLEISSNYLGISNITTFNDFVNMYLNPNLEVVLSSIKIINPNDEGKNIENTEETKVETKYSLEGLAVFKDNKLVGYLSQEESLSYNILKNNIENTILSAECEKDKYLAIEITKSKSDIKVKDKKVSIDIKLIGNLNECQCNLDLNDTKNITKMEKIIEENVKQTITKDINNIRNNYNSDIFNFIDTLYKHDYKTYQKVNNNWYNGIYKNLDLEINVDISITAKGKILEVINEKNK